MKNSQMVQSGPSLAESPSLDECSSRRLAEIAARVVDEFTDDEYDDVLIYPTHPTTSDTERHGGEEKGKEGVPEGIVEEEQGDDEEDDSDFEFAMVRRDDESPVSADEIFYNGQIRPIFPLFNTDLIYGSRDWVAGSDGGKEEGAVVEERVSDPAAAIRLPLKKLLISEQEATASCSSSEADELESLPPGTYCVWTPRTPKNKEILRKKSNSTGSSKRWKFRELLHRSSSDGNETFVFLPPRGSQKKAEKAAPATMTEEGKSGDRNVVAGGNRAGKAHEAHYLKSRAMRESDRKKSYLPYRQEIFLGFFANVNGLSRAMKPL
ncbi:hypothetical protein Dimus_023855 [Dionaea muscipula]